MSFEPTYQQFFENQSSTQFKYGTDTENGVYHSIEEGISPDRDGFLPGYLPENWGAFGESIDRQLTLSRYRLKSLKNCSKVVLGVDFHATNNFITSLQGGPQWVEEGYNVSANLELASLDGFPDYVGTYFSVRNCPKLSMLELARVDAGNKVRGPIYFSTGTDRPVLPADKSKCTRVYYDIVKNTAQGEQEDIGNI